MEKLRKDRSTALSQDDGCGRPSSLQHREGQEHRHRGWKAQGAFAPRVVHSGGWDRFMGNRMGKETRKEKKHEAGGIRCKVKEFELSPV